MEDKVVEIIQKITDNKELNIKSDIDLIENDLIDSLGFVELVSELEETFNIEIYPSQVPSSTWRTVSSIVEMVKNKVGEK